MHFTNIAKMLARDLPVGEVNAESYLSPFDNLFSLKTLSNDIFLNLLKKIGEKKANDRTIFVIPVVSKVLERLL